MKKTFLMLLAGIVLAGFTFTACDKDNPEEQQGQVVEQPDDETDEPGDETDEPGGDATDEPGGETPTAPASLSGTNYYVLYLDEDSFNTIAENVVLDLRVNDNNVFVYDWAGGYQRGICNGLGFYGSTEWFSLVSAPTQGWTGGAFCIKSGLFENLEAIKAIADEPENYYLHFAYKSNSTSANHAIFCDWNGDGANRHIIGSIGVGDFNDNGTVYPNATPVSGEFVAGEWNEYEFSIKDLGINFSEINMGTDGTGADLNIFAYLSGAATGTTLDLDAIFIYKK